MINEQEIEEIIEDFWEQNLNFRIWSSLDGADERDWVLDLKTLQTDYDNIGLRLYEAILEDTEFTIKKLNEKLQKEIEWDNEIKKAPQFKIINAPVYHFSKITKNHKLVEVHGVIKSLSQKLLNYVEAVYECNACGFHNHVEGLQAPKVCQGCGKKGGSFTLITEESIIEEYRELKIQEIIDVPKQVYDTLLVEIPEDLLNNITLGDRVAIVGMPQVKSTNQNSNKDKRVKEIFIKALNIYKLNDDEIKITQEDIEKIKEFSKREDLLDALAEMYAPAIVGHLNIKRAIILQAVGGVEKIIGETRKRGNIHILIVGDPGTAKSQLLMWHHNIMPKSIYVSDASGAGLTIAITKANDQISWEAGVMVLANNGVACIDEFEKMREEDREAIHPAMEQGVVSKSKAGIYVSAPANTSVLAVANPKFGRFDMTKPLFDQITLSPTILNRFDLIFFTKDQVKDENEEKEHAKKILRPEVKTSAEFLAKYIEYAKKFKPEITPLTENEIIEKYAKIRVSNPGKIAINDRNLEAILRLAEAHAKLRLSNKIMPEDVDVAFSLMSDFLEQIGFDIDKLNVPSELRQEINAFLDLIEPYDFIEYQKMRLIAEANDIKNLDLVIEVLKITGDIIEKDNGFIVRGKRDYAK
ncbi:MAG: minichromosome maintenance protein MCM [Thermoplasmata archaeon]